MVKCIEISMATKLLNKITTKKVKSNVALYLLNRGLRRHHTFYSRENKLHQGKNNKR